MLAVYVIDLFKHLYFFTTQDTEYQRAEILIHEALFTIIDGSK